MTAPARFLVFAGLQYYPAGGWDDFAGSYATRAKAVAAAKARRDDDWWMVVDLTAGRIVAGSDEDVPERSRGPAATRQWSPNNA